MAISSILSLTLLIFLLAMLSCFFSACEMSVIGFSKIKLRHMIDKGIKRAKSIQALLTGLDKFIGAILIGNAFVNIAISSIVTGIFVKILGYQLGVTVATFTTTFFVLIICEMTPKMLATKHTEKIALFTSPLMEKFVKVFHPVIIIFTNASNLILKLLRVAPSKRSALITEEELRTMIEIGKEEGVLSDEERKMLHRIFEFGDTKVGDVMVPKDKIIAVNIKSNPEELLNIFVEEGHARLPVYEGAIDNIVGIIYARDLLYVLRDKGLFLLEDLIHEAYYVAGAMRVNELLRKFQADKVQIAVVRDEQKKTQGIVTLEDLTEEIVGEIEQERPKRRIN